MHLAIIGETPTKKGTPTIAMMLKGYERRLIMMPTKNSPLFETAYFILRNAPEKHPPCPNEMLYEATRILEENSLTVKRRSIKLRHLAIAFSIGLALGAATVAVIWLVAL